MNKLTIVNSLGILILIILQVLPFFGAPKTAGVTNYDEVDATAIKIGGTNGSRIDLLIGTTCNLSNADASVAATSTGYVYCTGVTGLTAGDPVQVLLSTTTANATFGGWSVFSAKASTTAGAIDIRLYNGTGAAAVPSATAVGSTTNIWAVSTRSTVPGL